MRKGLARLTRVDDVPEDFEQLELRGFARSIAEIDWLLLLLVMLYYVAPDARIESPMGMVLSMVVFALYVLGFHYLNANSRQTRWKLAVESWVMIVFIAWVVWNTGGITSPLINLYVLAIITSAITLGKVVSLLEIVLIASFYFYIAMKDQSGYTYSQFVQQMLYFAPFVLVAYITTLLASDIHNSKKILKNLAETDDMTGLLNKRSLEVMFKIAAEKAIREKLPMTVMMIDTDNLKQVNDRYGHLAGDALIVTVSRTIVECLRSFDIICRYGGDEFVVVLPNTSADKAMEFGERVRKAVANTSFDVEGAQISTTICVGLATWPSHVEDISTLLARADTSLYACKRSGRNMVLHYGEEVDPYTPVPGTNAPTPTETSIRH
ncbi:MAG: GGDEF domain-containing protein [Pseudomonadota bacterium]